MTKLTTPEAKQEILGLAGRIPGHYLREVKLGCTETNSWGVYVPQDPEQHPHTLHIGVEASEFLCPCWPFMAAHEAVHSFATLYISSTNKFQYLLYNIFEDLRINRALLQDPDPEFQESYRHVRKVILQRWYKHSWDWENKSRTFITLQHLCFLNYMADRKVPMQADRPLLGELLKLRAEFLGNLPVLALPGEPRGRKEQIEARTEKNRKISLALLKKLEQQRVPHASNSKEILALLSAGGWLVGKDLQQEFQKEIDGLPTIDAETEEPQEQLEVTPESGFTAAYEQFP